MKVGRYLLFDEIASGGMAAVHFGRLVGDVGFSRTVAIKRLHAAYARDPDFVTMFLDEARLAARVSHPNVVQTLDVVALKDELFLVMEYVRGESLAGLLRTCERERAELGLDCRASAGVAAAILCGALHGLHAAHEATDPEGASLGIVHRDVSPHNVLVGTDGVARMLDFGIAKAITRLGSTRDGQLKGKLAYMAPEQLAGKDATRRSDIYAAGIVLWEALTARRCFEADTPSALMALVAAGPQKKPSEIVPGIAPELDAIVARACSRDPEARFATAREMAHALEAFGVAAPSKVGAWAESLAAPALELRAAKVAAIEAGKSETAADLGMGRPSFAELGGTGSMPAPLVSRAIGSDATVAEGSGGRAKQEAKSASRTRLLVAASVLAASGLAFGIWATVTRAGDRSARADATSSSNAASTASAPVPEESASAPRLVVSTGPTMTASSEPEPPPPATSTAKKAIASVRPVVSGAHSAKPPAPSCDPPYSLGPNGRHIPKPECL